MRYTPPETYSAKKALKEAQVVATQFEADCRAGKVLTKQEEMAQRKAQAEAAEREHLETAAKPTFKTYAEAWLKSVALDHALSTVTNYTKALARAGERFNDYKLEDITPNR